LEKHQPLAAPSNIRRYFLSPVEAGELCLLAATMCPHRHLLIPRLEERNLTTFRDVAIATLKEFDLSPNWSRHGEEAREDVGTAVSRGEYPVFLTSADTDGEKETEEFLGAGEAAVEIDLLAAQATPAIESDPQSLVELLRLVEASVTGDPAPSKTAIVEALARAVPGFAHRETGRSLDFRM
jgi:hypothetical protein